MDACAPYRKCRNTKCGEIEPKFNTELEFDVVAQCEAVIQPAGTILIPIKVRKPPNTAKDSKHCLWNLRLEPNLMLNLCTRQQRQPVRPCRFEALTLTNSSSYPFIINKGQTFARIDNKNQMAAPVLRPKFDSNQRPASTQKPKTAKPNPTTYKPRALVLN